ncbi:MULTISPECIES: type II toxin-antitoxin system YafQ family toxin [unclassified Mesorhizobium]|uniref:type II toxin-antitoxin system YafQ family toxin n=1 Tax=unclassified Mesorhizobium TaxID=325217 RepID=UPI003857EA1C
MAKTSLNCASCWACSSPDCRRVIRITPLKGDWKDYRDAHVEPDWLLIYRIADDELRLARTGSYSDLFNE